MKILLFSLFALFCSRGVACKVRYPSEANCTVDQKVELKVNHLSSLKRAVEKYYNRQEKFIVLREKQMTEKALQKTNRSTCFNLRHAEMYINYLLQNHTQSTTVCSDTVSLMIKSVEGMVQKDSAENIFIKDSRAKEQLSGLSVDVMSALESFKLENNFLE